MIKHVVLLDLVADHDPSELQAIMRGLDDLQPRIDGFLAFEHGKNFDFEGMSPQCAYGFICHFANEATSRAYLIDPEHQKLGGRLVALCKNGLHGITVVDLNLDDPQVH